MRNSVWRELAWAAGIGVLVLGGAVTAPAGHIPLDLGGYLLLVVPALAQAARRWVPLLVLGLATLCLLAYEVRGYPGVVAAVPVMFALYTTVKAGHRRAAGAAVAIVLFLGFAGERVFAAGGEPVLDVFQRWFLLIGWMVAAGVAGEVSRRRDADLDRVEQRAAEAERTREETARRRADEERLRIARDLHDSLTHCISIIRVQAGVAVHLARKHNEPVPEALVAIQQASGEAMRELRATLEVLRSEDERAGSGLDRLDDLIAGTRDAGLPVTVSVTGRRHALPVAVDRAAYRIIQEALTNTARHAGPATATVQLGYRDEELVVLVDDDGQGTGGETTGSGIGLIGMRERVTALGGSLHAGPRDGGGFRVRAEIPLAS